MEMEMTPERRISPEMLDESFEMLQAGFRRFRETVLERAGAEMASTDKNDGSPVTETDKEIELALQAELAERFPAMPVLGEETGYHDEDLDTLPAFWLLDPVDGTKAFIEGTPTFTGMAACVENGQTTRALIYNYTTDVMYAGERGQGTYRYAFDEDGQRHETRIDFTQTEMPATAMCKEELIPALDSLLGLVGIHCEKAPSGGGFGFTTVLDGAMAARFNLRSGGYTHDYAPGGLLVEEAGGINVPIKDGEYTFKTRSFVACHPLLEPTIRQYVSEIRALEK